MSEGSLIVILVIFCITIIALNSQSAHLKELSIKTLGKLLGGCGDKRKKHQPRKKEKPPHAATSREGA